ncbi:MAG: hypothetical protein ABSF98_09100 [Bryobacteraceae bacterium]
MASTKLILSSTTALTAKYGADLTPIANAIEALAAADAARGITSLYVPLDDTAAMQRMGVAPVASSQDQKQIKDAVDSLYRTHNPDYILLLGSLDVIPHQDLDNPLFDPSGNGLDPDAKIASDLPYACEEPYSTTAGGFNSITRVVARLPDITGGSDQSYLAGLLTTAAGAQTRSAADYKPYLGVSTQSWFVSTQDSVTQLFKDSDALQISPNQGPQWTGEQLSSLIHFFNCHGNPSRSQFFGQLGDLEPVSHDAAFVAGKLKDGTVAAMECCYGADLYDPGIGQPPMGNTYLASGAYGYLGSTTVSYGGETSTACADILCWTFLNNVLSGRSLGHALLLARQTFLQASGSAVEPHNAKALAQFILLGDPSIQPVTFNGSLAPAPAPPGPGPALVPKALDVLDTERAQRRRQLFTRGLQIGAQHSPVHKRASRRRTRSLESALQSLAEARSLRDARIMSYSPPREPRESRQIPEELRRRAPWPDGIHAIFGRYGQTRGGQGFVRLLMVQTRNDQVIQLKELHAR